ncbi:hypothetical protein D8S78_08145 [Natrialba swarupiae]|nr:hypothetical protein [Natrialba swarupiae]
MRTFRPEPGSEPVFNRSCRPRPAIVVFVSRFLDRFRVQRFILESRVDRSSPRLFPERRLSAATRTIRPGEPFGPIGRYIGYQQAILLDQLINYTCCT